YETERANMPQVCFPFATDAKGQTLYEYVQAHPQFLLGPGPGDETQKTRYEAHTGSWTERRSICALLRRKLCCIGKVSKAYERERTHEKYAVREEGMQGGEGTNMAKADSVG